MTEPRSLDERIATLEQVAVEGARRHRLPRVLVAIVALCMLVSTCWLLTLVYQAQAARRDADKERQFWLLCHPGATAASRVDAFLALVEAGNTEWKSARLSHLSLPGVDLDRADLSEATFESTDLSGASLVGTELINAELPTADLSGATLDGAQLDGANFLKSNLQGTTLRKVLARGVSLQQVTAPEADLNLADLSDADLRMANLTDANLTAANVAGADLTSAVLKRATLSYTNFSGSVLANVDFTDSNWWKARGLTADQLDYLERDFAPSDAMDEELRLEFEVWRETRESRQD